jgi:hypothetical protein
MKVSKNFSLHELVDEGTYEKFGDSSIWFLDPKAFPILQYLRDRFGPTTVNNWRSGGSLNYRGFRPIHCAIGGTYSQHRFGRGFDCSFKDATPDEVRYDIMKNELFYVEMGLTTIEDGLYSPNWLHFDLRNTGLKELKIVKP